MCPNREKDGSEKEGHEGKLREMVKKAGRREVGSKLWKKEDSKHAREMKSGMMGERRGGITGIFPGSSS